jgi:hypothetical protein
MNKLIYRHIPVFCPACWSWLRKKGLTEFHRRVENVEWSLLATDKSKMFVNSWIGPELTESI